jgi:hypothetical protein
MEILSYMVEGLERTISLVTPISLGESRVAMFQETNCIMCPPSFFIKIFEFVGGYVFLRGY